MSENFVKVWRFGVAPKEFQDLSTNGGDEDYVALVPKGLEDEHYHWLDSDAFGCCCIDKFDLPNGDRVYIGCHA